METVLPECGSAVFFRRTCFFRAIDKQSGAGLQALLAFRTSIVRVRYKQSGGAVQALLRLL